jgi:phytanoyl-CoA hydroxylase
MWFLQDGASLERQDLAPRVREALSGIRTSGVAILKNNIPAELCDEVNRDFGEYCEKAPESSAFRDENLLYERLACLHMVSEAARRIAFAPLTLQVIEAAFSNPAVIVGSLYFHKGSTQSIHRDTPAFFTNPLNHYFGVWTALEDVQPGSGPLIYYEKGHVALPDAKLFGDPSVNAQTYFGEIVAACEKRGLKVVEYYANKGDTLIWHPELPHGGAAILTARQSRRSIVFHYIPEGVPIHGADLFFGAHGVLRKRANYRTIDFGMRKVIDQGPPRFFHNRYEGNFDEA